MKVRNYKSGVIQIADNTKLRVKAGQLVNVRVIAHGCPNGYRDLENVPVVSVYGYKSKGSLGNPGGFLRVQQNGGWHGFSANAILKIEIKS